MMEAQTFSAPLNCPACHALFEPSNPPRQLASCSHHLCDSCIRLLIKDILEVPCVLACPVDSNPITFTNTKTLSAFPIDRTIFARLQTPKPADPQPSTTSCSTLADQARKSMLLNNQFKTPSASRVSKSHTSITETVASKNTTAQFNNPNEIEQQGGILRQPHRRTPSGHQREETICLIHEKPLDFVCVSDLSVICASCAIFGHKGHQFKTIKDFNRDKLQYCQKLLELTNHKSSLQNKMGRISANAKDMELRLEQKQKDLQAELRHRFRKLHDALDVVQSRCSDLIKEKLIEIWESLLSRTGLSEDMLTQMREWDLVVQYQLKVLQGSNTQDQMKCLNYHGKARNIIQEGSDILVKLEEISYKYHQDQKEDNSNSQSSLLDSIALCINDKIISKKIYGLIDGELLSVVNNRSQRNPSSPQKTGISSTEDIIDAEALVRKTASHTNREAMLIGTHESIQSNEISSKNQQAKGGVDTTFGRETPSVIVPELSIMSYRPSIVTAVEESMLSTKNPSVVINPAQIPQHSKAPRWTMYSPNPKPAFSRIRSEKSLISISARSMTSLNSNGGKKGVGETLLENRAKKLLSRMKIDAKSKEYERMLKIIVDLLNDRLEILDLSSCQLEETSIVQVMELLKNCECVRSVKLMKNRLTDEAVQKFAGCLGSIGTLNLSQNFLTQKVLDILIGERTKMPFLRSVVIDRNRIRERDSKEKLEELRNSGVVVTV